MGVVQASGRRDEGTSRSSDDNALASHDEYCDTLFLERGPAAKTEQSGDAGDVDEKEER